MEKTVRVCRLLTICKDIFITFGSLERAEKISWCRVSRSTIVVVQTEGRRRTVACTETTSCS